MNEAATPPSAGDRQNTVLVVDADIIVRLSVAGYLRECGYRVREAADAGEAMALLENKNIGLDVVLCEVGPGDEPGGFHLARWTRTNRPEVRVILVASAARAAAVAGELCSEGPMLTKPYDHKLLLARIRQLLAARSDTDHDGS